MPHRDTLHILDKFARREIYNIYKEYVGGAQENGIFITYSYFTRTWEKQFNNICIPKKLRMGICNTCASPKSRRNKFEGVEKGISLQNYLL